MDSSEFNSEQSAKKSRTLKEGKSQQIFSHFGIGNAAKNEYSGGIEQNDANITGTENKNGVKNQTDLIDEKTEQYLDRNDNDKSKMYPNGYESKQISDNKVLSNSISLCKYFENIKQEFEISLFEGVRY